MDTTLNGTDYPLYVDLTTPITAYGPDVVFPGNFQLLACLTTNGIALTINNISTSGKCSGFFETSMPGKVGWTMTADGKAISIVTPDARLSANKLLQLSKARTVFWGAIFNTSSIGLASSMVRYGLMFFTAYNETDPDNDAVIFTATLQGSGELFDEIATT